MTRKMLTFELALILAMVGAIAAVYPQLPSVIVTHWDSRLQPNGYSPRWVLFLLGPGVMTTLTLFTLLGPWLSPKKFEVESFQSTYNFMMLMLFCVFAYCCGVMLWADTGHRIDAGRAIQGGLCVLFAVLGNVMGKVRRNFFLGIKTPWALASERVWNATHRFAAKTFVAGGVLGLAFTLADLRVWPVYALLIGALAPVLFSLVYYKRLERLGEV